MSKDIFASLTKEQVKQITHLTKKTGSISAADLNRIIACKDKANGDSHKVRQKQFVFECIIASQAPDEVRVLLKGRHHSKNDIDSWPLRKKLAYKSAIKRAFADAALLYRKHIPKTPFGLVEIDVVVTLKRSRDDDSPQETTKRIRDCCIDHGIIVDDSRKVVLDTRVKEVIGKEYSIELIIKNKEQKMDSVTAAHAAEERRS